MHKGHDQYWMVEGILFQSTNQIIQYCKPTFPNMEGMSLSMLESTNIEREKNVRQETFS